MATPPASRRPVQVLSANVAERIAAGEVIERPASVVKELVENSLDAGATEVLVALEDGGKSLIEITDNGHGMGPDDLALCVRRHATSKLASIEDLEAIRTLGFRGEALPSVAAVAELSILTRGAHGGEAHELRLPAVSDHERFEDRKIQPQATTFGHFLGSPHGTRIQARGLFAHVPARLKFLKSQGAEVSGVREWLERLALAHPGTGFRLVSDGRQVLQLRPQSEVERVRAILADGEDYPILSASSDLGAAAGALGVPDRAGGGVHVRVHWLQGLSSPQMRKLVQVVNGRAVRDRMLQQALLAPFRQRLLPGQFPAVALYVDIDPALIDVNVHPAKTEIRFLESRKVFHQVDELIDGLLAREGAPAHAAGPAAPMSFGSSSYGGGAGAFGGSPSDERPFSGFQFRASESGGPLSQVPLPMSGASGLAVEPRAPAPQADNRAPLQLGRLAGTLFNTYFLYESGDELVLIDQHAAHERVRYEQLRRRALGSRERPVGNQQLLIPEAVGFAAESRETVESRLGWLARLGFEAEVFGEDTLLFRALPPEWGSGGDLRARLRNLTERLVESEAPRPGAESLGFDESLFERLASEACHSAVRAGDRLLPEEAAALVEQLFACEQPWNCPHGRPTVVKVPRARFEEWFQRRV